MTYPIAYYDHLMSARRNQTLMARIALNAAQAGHPVRLSELQKLGDVNRAVVMGFLSWMDINAREWEWGEPYFSDLLRLAGIVQASDG